MNIDWFTMDWAKRWGLPLATLSAGIGALVGATQYRFGLDDANARIPFNPRTTVTATATETRELAGPIETRVVRETVTLTPRVAPPVTVVRELPSEPSVVTRTAEPPDPETTTVTVAPDAESVLEAVRREKGKNNAG